MKGSPDPVEHTAQKPGSEFDGKEITRKTHGFPDAHSRGVFVNLQVHPLSVNAYDLPEKALFSHMHDFVKGNRRIRSGLDDGTRYSGNLSCLLHEGHLTRRRA
jgi:hypothetical protein